MRVRYKRIENPSFSIKETPSEAYLIIEGKIFSQNPSKHLSLAKRSDSENCVCKKIRNSKHKKADDHRSDYLDTKKIKEKEKRKSGHGYFTFRDLNKA